MFQSLTFAWRMATSATVRAGGFLHQCRTFRHLIAKDCRRTVRRSIHRMTGGAL